MSKLNIKVLGPGCANCKKLLETTKEAVSDLGIDADIKYVTEMAEISKYIMMTPGLVINEKVAHQGKPLLNAKKIKALINKVSTD
jgi:small redox-active disulfide protein 2